MYQTVGSNLVPAIAEAMEIPLYRKKIRGKAKVLNLEYTADPETMK
jgi:diphthamide synthase (EF-2-diphthine--ammonia ligase)